MAWGQPWAVPRAFVYRLVAMSVLLFRNVSSGALNKFFFIVFFNYYWISSSFLFFPFLLMFYSEISRCAFVGVCRF